jgi:uncharacterized membrane protein YhaH (DUF805 family)
MFKNLFSFNGRIRRTEYGLSFIIYVIFYIILRIVLESFPEDQAAIGIIFLCFIPMVWFIWSQSAKRCHDLNRSGWYQLIPFYFLILLFQEGNKFTNEYGPDPKNPNQNEFDPAYYQDPETKPLDSN